MQLDGAHRAPAAGGRWFSAFDGYYVQPELYEAANLGTNIEADIGTRDVANDADLGPAPPQGRSRGRGTEPSCDALVVKPDGVNVEPDEDESAERECDLTGLAFGAPRRCCITGRGGRLGGAAGSRVPQRKGGSKAQMGPCTHFILGLEAGWEKSLATPSMCAHQRAGRSGWLSVS